MKQKKKVKKFFFFKENSFRINSESVKRKLINSRMFNYFQDGIGKMRLKKENEEEIVLVIFRNKIKKGVFLHYLKVPIFFFYS